MVQVNIPTTEQLAAALVDYDFSIDIAGSVENANLLVYRATIKNRNTGRVTMATTMVQASYGSMDEYILGKALALANDAVVETGPEDTTSPVDDQQEEEEDVLRRIEEAANFMVEEGEENSEPTAASEPEDVVEEYGASETVEDVSETDEVPVVEAAQEELASDVVAPEEFVPIDVALAEAAAYTRGFTPEGVPVFDWNRQVRSELAARVIENVVSGKVTEILDYTPEVSIAPDGAIVFVKDYPKTADGRYLCTSCGKPITNSNLETVVCSMGASAPYHIECWEGHPDNPMSRIKEKF